MRAAWVPTAAALKSATPRVKREAGERPALPPQRYAAGLPSATEVLMPREGGELHRLAHASDPCESGDRPWHQPV